MVEFKMDRMHMALALNSAITRFEQNGRGSIKAVQEWRKAVIELIDGNDICTESESDKPVYVFQPRRSEGNDDEPRY